MKPRLSTYTCLLLILSLPAQAHTGAGAAHSFTDGLLHPLLGIDHTLVMLAIGLWAAMLRGRALWLLPLSFLTMMIGGVGLQLAGFEMTAAEAWVAFSVLASGAVLLGRQRISAGLAGALVAVFALGHGYVHATEITDRADALVYAPGFLLTTAFLHGLGIAAGLLGGAKVKNISWAFGLLCTVVGAALLLAA